MKGPSTEAIVNKSVVLLLRSMQATDDGSVCSAETKIASAVVLLSQLIPIPLMLDPELQDQLDYCRQIILGK